MARPPQVAWIVNGPEKFRPRGDFVDQRGVQRRATVKHLTPKQQERQRLLIEERKPKADGLNSGIAE